MKTPNQRCRNCGTALNQYNTDPLCAPCSRTDAAPEILDTAWRNDRVYRALTDWEFGELLRVLRRRAGLSQMDVRSLTGLSQSYISDLENGRKQLGGRDAIVDFLNGLGLPPDLRPLLLTPFGGVESPAPREAPDPALPWTADRMVTSLEVAVGGSMKRRNVLAALGGAGLTQYVLQSAVAPREAMAAPSADGTKVSAPLVESLQITTDELRGMDARSGSGTLVGTARDHLNTLLRLMKHGDYDERTGRRLAAVTADTAIQTGWFTFDGGAHAAAQQMFLGALRAAHASGDSRLRAGALSYLAIHGYSVADARGAVTAARTARQSIGDQDSPALHAMLLTRQARGHARLHEERHALAALAEAEELCARGPGEDDPHWLYWINPGEILGQTGSCYLDLGQPDKAATSFAAARHVLSRNETRTHAQFLTRAATAQMRAGDADAGCATAQEVLNLVDGVRSARLDEHLHSMLREARRFNDAAPARALLERGQAVMKGRSAS
ncbi:helix-turn-helix transcriptional regulator [Streptomyces sp. JV176]|uniref:helix-turn-helix domain-containing protein n=1 Tax=Streptomyces sp. JV176 TaxID=858630 RepID=UPI002E7732BC|nr:helix-turn-helix transcriptional regulator [Streptomyces sp. JV176]MEE1798103.1 helix-turn-helix transcriptional regulator [Streptomyces sp. JV176]